MQCRICQQDVGGIFGLLRHNLSTHTHPRDIELAVAPYKATKEDRERWET